MGEDEEILKEIIEMNNLLIKDDPEEDKTEYCKEADFIQILEILRDKDVIDW